GAKILKEKLKNRLAGSDMVKKIFETYEQKSYRAFILLKDNSLTKQADLANVFSRRFKNWTIKSAYFQNNEIGIYNQINNLNPEFVFVALGAPEQEKLATKIAKFCPDVKVIMAVGGSFDFLTGKIKRAPQIIRELGMEWLYRLYQEPKRLGRIKNATVDFLLRVHEWNKRIKTQYRKNVVGVIFNKSGEVLIQKNRRFINHWQFPQGGVDKNENFEQAILREIEEELGIKPKFLQITKKIPQTNTYVAPRYGQLLQGYKGQEQTAFLLNFTGEISDIKFQGSEEVEEIKFVPVDQVEKLLHRDRAKFWQIIKKYVA
ncbi:MAG: WecB/TagA/CpsF family glycosyltransferase, partial [Patescibacteria group bacterium]